MLMVCSPFFCYLHKTREAERGRRREGDNACLISWGKHSNNKRLSRKMQQPNALITRRATCDICQGHGQQWQREKQRQSKPFNEAFNALATLRLSTSRTTSVTRSCSERAIKPQPLPCSSAADGAVAVPPLALLVCCCCCCFCCYSLATSI